MSMVKVYNILWEEDQKFILTQNKKKKSKIPYFQGNIIVYFMLSDRISRNITLNIFRSYTGTTSENTDFHVLVA